MTEFLLILFLAVPLSAAALNWYWLEMNRCKCAYQNFAKARQRLIELNSSVRYSLICETIHEQIELSSLEELDQAKGGLRLSDLGAEASQAWADALRWSRSLRELASTNSSRISTELPNDKSSLINALDNL